MKTKNRIKISKLTKNLNACLFSIIASSSIAHAASETIKINIRAPLTDGAHISPDGGTVVLSAPDDIPTLGDKNLYSDVIAFNTIKKTYSLISLTTSGKPANGDSSQPSVSAGGRYVAFQSSATNLIAKNTNGNQEIFLRDRVNKSTIAVSVSGNGTLANDNSFSPKISADGRYVAFLSYANNLVSGDINFSGDIFVRDLLTGQTQAASVDNAGHPVGGNFHIISNNGRYIAFSSTALQLKTNSNHAEDAYLHDRLTGTTVSISDNEAPSVPGEIDHYLVGSISNDGKLASIGHTKCTGTFHPSCTGESYIYNLGTKKKTNEKPGIISSNRQYMVYQGKDTTATNLSGIGIFVLNRLTGITEKIPVDGYYITLWGISANAQNILYLKTPTPADWPYFYVYRRY